MKKVLSVLLAVCLLVGCLPLAASAETYQGWCGDDLRYTLDTGTGELRISGTGPMADSPTNRSTWYDHRDDIKSVVVEPGVTSIGVYSFAYLSSLESAVLPDTVTAIKESSFEGCEKLKECSLPGNLTHIGEEAFEKCFALTSVNFPDTLVHMGDYAFRECTALTSVHIPGSLKEIPYQAFYFCSRIKNLVIEEGVETIGADAFVRAAIETLTIPASVTSLGSEAFADNKPLKTVNMIGGGTILPLACFVDCTSLQRIKLPNELTEVTDRAFAGCTSLQRIDYPAGVVRLGIGVHRNNKSLTCVTFATPAGTKISMERSEIDNKGVTVLYSNEDTGVKAYAIENSLDWQLIGSQPEDTWVPGQDVPSQPDKPDIPDIPVTPKFTDIKKGDFFYDAVQWAVEKGVTSGTTVTTFSPGNPCDRGQIVTFLWRANGSPNPTSTLNPFVDVKSGDYYYKAVLWAVENNITSGTDATHFSPKTPCNRGQAVTFLWRANGRPAGTGKSFADVKSGQFYTDAVKWAVGKNITSGTSSTTFSPNQSCTRGQIVTFLYRDKQ